jgi:hypothetical protein
MRTDRVINILSKVALLMIGAIALMTVFGWIGLAGASGVITYANVGTSIPDGTSTHAEAIAKDVLNMSDVQRRVEMYKQYQTPLLSLISENKAPSVESWKYEFYAVDNRELYTTCTAAGTISTAKVVTIAVESSEMFTRYNTVSFTGITDKTPGNVLVSSGNFLVGIVTAIGEDAITVKLLNPGANLESSDFESKLVYRAGSAMNETAASTTAWGKLPEKDYNLVQNFMEQVEESEFNKLMKKEADWGMKDLKRMAIEDFKMQRERTFLTGIRAETALTIDGKNNTIYTCGGFLNDALIPATDNQDLSELDATVFTSWLKDIFTGNNGAKNRYLLGGADIIEAIENVSYNKYIKARETSIEHGIEFVKLVSTFGTLSVTYYEQMDLLGMKKDAIVLDKSNIWTGDLKGAGFNIRPVDYKTSGISKVDAAVIEQSSTMLIKNKPTHRIIKGV